MARDCADMQQVLQGDRCDVSGQGGGECSGMRGLVGRRHVADKDFRGRIILTFWSRD